MIRRNWVRKFYEEEPGAGGGEGGGETSWMEGLPADMQANATLKDIQSVEALAKRFIDTKAMVGNSIRVPSEDAPAEDMAAFRTSLLEKNVGLMAVPDVDNKELMADIYKAIGQPDDAAGYTKPENWVGMSDERFGALAAEAHKAGLSKSQFESVANTMAADTTALVAKMDTDFKADIDTLKGDWGRAYDQKVARATNIATQLEAPPALIEALAGGNADSATLRWLDKVAEKFGAEGTTLVTDPGGLSEHTPTELQERVADITKKMQSMSVSDPQYQPMLEKRMKFLEMLNPEKG